MAGIKIKNLNKSYILNEEKYPVIKNLNLEIDTRGICVILGKSGCGKTSLLRLIQGLEGYESGQIDTSNLKIATVFQEPLLFSWLNVYRNISFSLDKKIINEDDINELIDFIGLEKFKYSYPSQFSIGMKARVSLARALAYKPDYLLMDEPFAALDYFTKKQMQDEIVRLHKTSGLGILFVTHSIDEALLLASRILIMEKGTIKKEFEIQDEERDLLSNKFINLKRLIIESLKEDI